MEKNLARLKNVLNEIYDINAATAVLSWDQQTYMPKGGAEERACQLAALSKISHEKFCSPEVGQLLNSLEKSVPSLSRESDEACLIRVTRHLYNKKTKVPAKLVAEFASVTSIAQTVWEEARAKSDFAMFRPHLEKIVSLRQEYAALFSPYDHIYDPLLDDFEPGLKTAEVSRIFNEIKPEQSRLVEKISGKPEINNSFLFKPLYDEQRQWDFGVKVASAFGYDWTRGRQDRTAHPFTTTFGQGDVRITTRVFKDNLMSGLFSTMHEAGHAIYEQGISRLLKRTVLSDGASLAIHESQSRMWENLVGRSRDFWTYFYPKLMEKFSDGLAGVSMENFYRAINKVKPSLIRVEADEATYNLHIMLRFELEKDLMENKIQVKDLPELWRIKMCEYLNVCPEKDSDGVLQDVHWSCGIFGYFPTYAIGNLVSAQLWEKINAELPGLSGSIRNGEFKHLLSWLRDKIHRHGAKFSPQELVKKATGSEIRPEPYLAYLKKKFGDIYGLN
ncbi:MAG: carboxypeptidase [Lentisphaerae bacterium GWF2_45_14]|nr:MAG: carboxypeptidase [Lentisphaerae bacterium GWF2_45_14]